MKFYGEDQFNEQNSQGYNNGYYQNPQQGYDNGYYQNPQQGYDNGYYQNPQQGYDNGYYQNPQQQQYYNNTGYQDPMMDGEFHSPNFNNRPYHRGDYYKSELEKTREKMREGGKTTGGKLKGIFFLLWFIGSIVAAMILIKNTGNVGWVVALFGQVFAVAGIMAFVQQKNKLENAIILILPLIGGAMFIGGLVMVFGTQMLLDMIADYVPYIILGLFFIVGLMLTIITPISNKKKKARCTIPVNAVVVDLIRTGSGKRRTYAPLFEYNYKGVLYRERENNGANAGLPMVGQEMTIYLSEDDPTDFYAEWGGKNVMPIFIGVFFMAFPVIVVAMMLSQYFK